MELEDVSATKDPDGQLGQRQQFAAYLVLSLVTLVFTIILLPSSNADFRRFFGETNAIIVVAVASVVGAAALWVLQTGYGFAVLKGKATQRGVALSAALATVLGIAIVVADFIIRYPKDINVPVPQALLFYPAVGFVAEIAFHVVPLAVLLVILGPLSGRLRRERVVWLGILIVAGIEPSFHVLSLGNTITWSGVYTWIHIYVFALLQLYVFQRFDFVSMYSARLIYYAYWHVLWGVIRLEVLF
jgi:hypothetical protein